MLMPVDASPKQVIPLELREAATPIRREASRMRCRVILLDDAARTRAAAKTRRGPYETPDPDNLTAA
ncbi:MAG TPA: hypothetical protein VFL57_02860 [Bryobacteraceae bacterium]|nr:hypothetical protein [Bryobacteraceae bacterium]